MLNKLWKVLAAALVAASFTFVSSVQADEGKDKGGAAEKMMDCGYCKAVKNVCTTMRCDGCKDAAEQCQHCMDMAKKCMDMAMCQACMDMKKDGGAAKPVAACGECTKMMAHMKKGHCDFCDSKAMVAEHAACCKDCKAKGEKAMGACAKCQEMKKMMMSAKCPTCEGKKKG